MTEQEYINEFGDRLAKLLYEKNMTQKELAYEANLSEMTISNYIHKKQMPSIRAIVNIIYVTGCSISYLADFSGRIKREDRNNVRNGMAGYFWR